MVIVGCASRRSRFVTRADEASRWGLDSPAMHSASQQSPGPCQAAAFRRMDRRRFLRKAMVDRSRRLLQSPAELVFRGAFSARVPVSLDAILGLPTHLPALHRADIGVR